MANVKRVVTVASAAIVGSLVAMQSGAVVAPMPPKKPVPTPVPAGPVTTPADIADRIIGVVAGVKEGEVVWIQGNTVDMAFIEELELAVKARGGYVLLDLTSDAMQKKALTQVPAAYDGKAPKVGLDYAKLANVIIRMQTTQDDSIYLNYPADRGQIQSKAYAPVDELLRKRKVRQVYLDNGMYPGVSRAKEAGLPQAEMAKRFWAGLGADYAGMQATAAAYQKWMASSKEVHITASNGTDLTFQIKGRKVAASDGVISDADVKAGGSQVLTYLPAGEVFVSTVPGTAKGKLVDDRLATNGTAVTGISADVDKGKITKIDAKQGWDLIKPYWDKASPAKAEISVFDLGINTTVTASPTFEPYPAAGMIGLTIGGNEWAGGSNKEPFSLTFMLTGCTVTLDGVTLVDKGVLQPPPAAPAKPPK